MPKALQCGCGKRFKTDRAMRQHQHDSPLHADVPSVPEPVLRLDQILQRLSLQDEEAEHGFIPFEGGGRSTILAMSPEIRISGQVIAGAVTQFVAEGTKPKKKKGKKGKSLRMGQGCHSSWRVNPNTGQMMNLHADQDWMLCDKDCGWCGHCGDGVDI
ncbi:hypothetical protein DL98DRAFT_607639 [Cadophora sp. DSE1049]|nr:hypothetical protein DL98DRAFT_607639 [Cadophora sp. DSE1049]